jgi:hypothetical protein
MDPRKFMYQESSLFATHRIIEWKESRLHTQRQYRSTDPDACDEAFVNIDGKTWSEFQRQVTALELDPIEPDGELICDGLQVECHITFYRRLIKFEQSEPKFKGLDELQRLINNLTICAIFPKGVLLY